MVYPTLYDAVRFVNWLQNGQGSGDTESGTYTITNGGYNSGVVTVPDAAQRGIWAASGSFHWLVPSEDEWYKAAYYNGPAGKYYAYPLGLSFPPRALPPPGVRNSGNFDAVARAFDGNGNSIFLTDVGAYPQSQSPFGSFDMGGNVYQWNDTAFGPSPGLRGSAFGGPPGDSAASFRLDGIYFNVSDGGGGLGFRVASVGGVPEPATILMVVIGLAGLLIFSQRGRAVLRPRPGRDVSH